MSDSDCKAWFSGADLLGTDSNAPIALLGAPLAEKSLTPGRCDLGPKVLRAALARMSAYDVEDRRDLSAIKVFDAGDMNLKLVDPAAALAPIVAALRPLLARHELAILVGGNNAITRPAVHALGVETAGLLTLDAHFDLRDTDCGLNNGNPVSALLEDGMAGARIAQIGLAPFANTKKAHDKARAAGIHVVTARQCREQGFAAAALQALEILASRAPRIHVDFDIDVISRAEFPAAPGARPGGISASEFFAATRAILRHPKVVSVDLTEFDPSLDANDLSALTVARWFMEVLAGFAWRG